MSLLDIISQIGIAILGISTIILLAKKNKWGFVVGLASQPFWFITSYLNGQWGVFFLNIIYVLSYFFGIYEWFLKDKNSKQKII